MQTQTVAELEQEILSGKQVTAEQFAAAKASEEAAERIEKLTRMREEQLERERVHKLAAAEFDEIQSDFADFIASDTEIPEIIAEFQAFPLKYKKAVLKHNRILTDFRARLSAFLGKYPTAKSFSGSISSTGDGGVWMAGFLWLLARAPLVPATIPQEGETQ